MADVAREHGIENVNMVIQAEGTPDRRRYNTPV